MRIVLLGTLLTTTLALCACGGSVETDAGLTSSDAGLDSGPPPCPDASGSWMFEFSCAMSAGGFYAQVTQAGCDITLVQMDDGTPMSWTSTGTIGADGAFSLAGELGFSSAESCTGALASGTWTMTCDACTVTGARP